MKAVKVEIQTISMVLTARGGLGDGDAGGRPNEVLKLRAEPDRLIGCPPGPIASLICEGHQNISYGTLLFIKRSKYVFRYLRKY